MKEYSFILKRRLIQNFLYWNFKRLLLNQVSIKPLQWEGNLQYKSLFQMNGEEKNDFKPISHLFSNTEKVNEEWRKQKIAFLHFTNYLYSTTNNKNLSIMNLLMYTKIWNVSSSIFTSREATLVRFLTRVKSSMND